MQQPIEILLVEDSAGDVRLTQVALGQSRIANNLSVARDGEEALEFLHRRAPYQDAPRPDLILLDLNMPRKNGREVLSEVKADDDLKSIPIVVLTTSQAERDICDSYRLHANCYVQKPLDFRQFLEVMRSIEDFWMSLARLPKEEQRS